jgi:protoglobin
MPGMVDWSARTKEMAEFVGLGQDDLELVQTTAPLLLQHADELTSAIYDRFLKFPNARQFFLTNDGEVDQDRLARRKHSLTRWLRASGEFKVDEQFPVFLLAIGLVHSHPPTALIWVLSPAAT